LRRGRRGTSCQKQMPQCKNPHFPQKVSFYNLCYYGQTMRILNIALWLALGSIALTATEYQIKAVNVLPIESYPARKELAGVTVAADPYSSDERSFTAFDIKHLNSRGYFPVHVIIKNGTSKFLSIKTRNVVLVTGSGQKLYTTPTTLVVDDIIKSGLAPKTPKKAKSKNSGSPLSDFTNKELTNRIIDPDSITDGFLFFFTPNPHNDFFVGSSLFIPQIEEEGTKNQLGPFLIPLDSSGN
jgi:hypothetical protein